METRGGAKGEEDGEDGGNSEEKLAGSGEFDVELFLEGEKESGEEDSGEGEVDSESRSVEHCGGEEGGCGGNGEEFSGGIVHGSWGV